MLFQFTNTLPPFRNSENVKMQYAHRENLAFQTNRARLQYRRSSPGASELSSLTGNGSKQANRFSSLRSLYVVNDFVQQLVDCLWSDVEEAFKLLLKTVEQKSWVVYAKKPFASPDSILDYLGRYTHRVALQSSNLFGP